MLKKILVDLFWVIECEFYVEVVAIDEYVVV